MKRLGGGMTQIRYAFRIMITAAALITSSELAACSWPQTQTVNTINPSGEIKSTTAIKTNTPRRPLD